jgi:hypothetical protein
MGHEPKITEQTQYFYYYFRLERELNDGFDINIK